MQDVSVGAILSGTWAAIKEQGKQVTLWVVAITALGVLIDQLPLESSLAATIAFAVFQCFAQSDLVRRHLATHALISEAVASRPRIASVFFNGVLFGLGVGFGVVLLIIPGIYLAARWWVSVPAMLTGETAASEGLGQSWDITKDHILDIAMAMLVFVIPTGLAMVTLFYADDGYGNISLPLSVLANFLIGIGYTLLWLSGSATYMLLNGGRSRLQDIFE